MAKKSKRVVEKSKRFSNKQLIAASAIVVCIIVSGSVLSFWLTKAPEAKFPLNAIIIDQLGKEADFLNATFVNSATDILKSGGFNVTYYNGTVDVAFYRTLAKSNYGIIILRAHSALRQTNDTVDIFTSEQYIEGSNKYEYERENQQVSIGEFLYKPGQYFYAITSKFIDNLEGSFPKSIVIAMGCWSLKPGLDDKLPRSFINKGASAYIGWTDLVTAPDTDAEIITLLKSLLIENRTLGDAVSMTNSHTYLVNGQPTTSELRSYPSSANSLSISTLINEAKTASAFQNSPYVAVNFAGLGCGPREKRAQFSD